MVFFVPGSPFERPSKGFRGSGLKVIMGIIRPKSLSW